MLVTDSVSARETGKHADERAPELSDRGGTGTKRQGLRGGERARWAGSGSGPSEGRWRLGLAWGRKGPGQQAIRPEKARGLGWLVFVFLLFFFFLKHLPNEI